MRPTALLPTAAVLCAASALAAEAPRSPTPEAEPGEFQVIAVARNLEHPWGLAVLEDGRMIVTERAGRMRIVSRDGQLSEPLDGLPRMQVGGQGGLLDVTASPTFAQDRLLYFTFSEPGQGGASTAVARGRLGQGALEDVEVIWRQQPKVQGGNHWGSRLVFHPDGTLFVTLGDRFDYRDLAQDLRTTIGKIVRIHPDGSIPDDNPFVGRADVRPEIWSYGHRNIQAAALHPQTNELWTVEHGARGGDELNHPQAGRNYGWPVITYGVDYSGAKIGEGTAKAGMEQPVYYWDPVIAPSGAIFYTGEAFTDWRGDLLVGSLNPGALVRLQMGDGRVTEEIRYLPGKRARIRAVRQDANGAVYLLTDSPRGELLRLEPIRGSD
ncbi:MAG: hypothetical protein DIU71_10320 [Proteobacteria bacterium]|nr:MAG: hypothetical protein DIU71_10320 [Pseudomonadota bacterium]